MWKLRRAGQTVTYLKVVARGEQHGLAVFLSTDTHDVCVKVVSRYSRRSSVGVDMNGETTDGTGRREIGRPQRSALCQTSVEEWTSLSSCHCFGSSCAVLRDGRHFWKNSFCDS